MRAIALNDRYSIYSDGACSGNPGPGAWGYVVFFRGIIVQSDSGFESMTTNNRMELIAFKNILENFDNCDIFLDSKYVLDGVIKWLPNWKKNNWKSSSGAVKNKDLWEAIDILYSNRIVELFWEKGHNNSLHDYVDLLARNCCSMNFVK